MAGAAFMLFLLLCVGMAGVWVHWAATAEGATRYACWAIALVCCAAPSILLAIIQS